MLSSLRKAGRPTVITGATRRLTPAQAAANLQAGQCMYASTGPCSGPPHPVGLRDKQDSDVVLCCRAHTGRLGKLRRRPQDLGTLHSHLRATQWD